LVEQVLEALVPPRHRVVAVRRRREPACNVLPRRRGGPVESAGGGQAVGQQRLPRRQIGARLVIYEAGDALAAEVDHVGQFQACEPDDANRRGVGERVGVAPVPFQGGVEGGQGVGVQADEQRRGRRGGE